jgi:hypothetical protein
MEIGTGLCQKPTLALYWLTRTPGFCRDQYQLLEALLHYRDMAGQHHKGCCIIQNTANN